MSDEWQEIKRDFTPGTLVSAVVVRHEPFGVFVDIGYGAVGHECMGLIQIIDMGGERPIDPERFPVVGTSIQAVVLACRDQNKQVLLSIEQERMASARKWISPDSQN